MKAVKRNSKSWDILYCLFAYTPVSLASCVFMFYWYHFVVATDSGDFHHSEQTFCLTSPSHAPRCFAGAACVDRISFDNINRNRALTQCP